MTNVTCRLTAKKPGSAPCPTLVTEYGTTLLIYLLTTKDKDEITELTKQRLAANSTRLPGRP